MSFRKEFKKLFKKNLDKKNLDKKNLDKNPMSITDNRVLKLQEVLGQIAGFEEVAISKKEEALKKNLTDSGYDELSRRLLSGEGLNASEKVVYRQGRKKEMAFLKVAEQNREYRKDIKQLGRFLHDPLTPEEKQAKQAKQAKKLRDLFEKILGEKPMSIKDPRLVNVQAILKQRAEIELKASLKDSAKNYSAEKNSAIIESTEQRITTLLKAGMAVDSPEILDLHQESKGAHAAELKEKTTRVFRQELNQLRSFVVDPLPPEETQAKKAKQATKKAPKKKSKGMKM